MKLLQINIQENKVNTSITDKILNDTDLFLTNEQAKILLTSLSRFVYVSTKEICMQELNTTLDNIINNVATVFNLDIKDLFLHTRQRHIVTARQLCIYLLKRINYGTLSDIGRVFKKDHSTVIHAIKSIDLLIETHDIQYFHLIKEVLNNYQSNIIKHENN